MIRKTRNVVMLSGLVLLMLLVCLPAALARSAIYYVSTDGNDTSAGTSPKLAWRTITHAAKTAKAGDLVRIKAGNYGPENVVVANSGTPEAPIRFEGYDGEVKIEGKDVKQVYDKWLKGKKLQIRGRGVNIDNKSHIKISGFTVLKYGLGISVTNGSHHITVERCTAGMCGWSSIQVTGSHHCQVRHCTTYNCEMANITVGDSHDIAIADCWSYADMCPSRWLDGVKSDYCYGVMRSRNVHFTRCRGDGRRNGSGHGLEFTRGGGGPETPGCSDCSVTDCEIYNAGVIFGVRHKGHDITFVNCYAEGRIVAASQTKDLPRWRKQTHHNAHNQGFYFRTGSSNITVKNCRVRNVMIGLYANNDPRYAKKEGNTRNVTFENCIATECLCGSRLNAPDTKLLNCLIARNKHGLIIRSTEGLSVKGCIICQNDVGIQGNVPTATTIAHCNIWDNDKRLDGKVSLGADCISKDPQFVIGFTRVGGPGPDYGHWRLKETSPCKNMGPYADDPKASIGMR